MKKLALILTIISSVSLRAQSDDLTMDIKMESLERIGIKSKDSLMIKFRNYAIDLFSSGTEINDTIWENREGNIVGICLISNDDTLAESVYSFNLYALNYRDNRETDFHKRIYFDEGSEAISCFYVKCRNEAEVNVLTDAIDSYLKKDSIPFNNQAYKFSKNRVQTDYSEKLSPSDGISTLAMGYNYSYLRRNGNYLIQIQSRPQFELEPNVENMNRTEPSPVPWSTITVFILDEKDGRAYNKFFDE